MYRTIAKLNTPTKDGRVLVGPVGWREPPLPIRSDLNHIVGWIVRIHRVGNLIRADIVWRNWLIGELWEPRLGATHALAVDLSNVRASFGPPPTVRDRLWASLRRRPAPPPSWLTMNDIIIGGVTIVPIHQAPWPD